MSFTIGQYTAPADVIIDHTRCIGCGACVKVCKGAPLQMQDGRVTIDQSRIFGCIACGHCVSVCPTGCIEVNGRGLSTEDSISLPNTDQMPGYEQLMALLTKRRSTREFQDRDVEPELISKIIEAVETAPSGVPPSQVHAIVFSGRDKVQQLRRDMTQALRAKKWLISPTILALMKPFMGKSGARMMEEFVKPVFELYFRCDEEGTDWFLYDAPLGILFYGNEFSDPADGFIASTYAMLAAESLGLGNCMLGFPGLIFKYDKNLRKKYGLPNGMQPGVFVIFGHPDTTYRKALRRHIAGVEHA